MKILQIIAQKPGNTGSGIFLESLVKEMNRKGYSQSVVAGISRDDRIKLFNNKIINYYPVEFESEKLPFPVVGMSDEMPYKSTKYKDMDKIMFSKWEKAFRRIVKKAVEEFKPDIILSHHLWILTSLVKKWYPNIPMIGISHGTDLRQLGKLKKYSNAVIKECRNIETIFALNDFQKEKIQEKYGIDKKKIFTMGSAYNGDIFYPDYNEKENQYIKLVYAGKLSYAKGLIPLINAYIEIDETKKKLKLIIAGSGEGEESKTIINKCRNIKKSVKFTGMVTQNELGDIFRKSDIFVLPSFYEGLPLVLIEALACGLRVVTTDLPGVKKWMGEEVNKTGIISYVPLPELTDSDQPVEEDLPKFTKRLKESIEKQIDEVYYKKDNKEKEETVDNRIRQLCWESLFSKIEKHFSNLIY